MRRTGLVCVFGAAVVAGCGSHHVSMNAAAYSYVCGDICKKNVEIKLSNVRTVEDWATAEIAAKPPRRIPGNHVLLHRVGGDWNFRDAWHAPLEIACADVAQQMRVPESILHRLEVC
jgi:hypothetical protein